MSFAINITGHGANDDDVRGAFEEAVRGLRDATPVGGTLSATLSSATGNYTQDDVPDEPGDTDEDEEDA